MEIQDMNDQMDNNIRTSHRFLEIANQHVEMKPLLSAFVFEIQDMAGCEAVGIRVLDENGQIPYQAYTGFSQQFYEEESPLSIECDRCMCINVIKGTTNPDLLFYTSRGSFLTRSTTRLLSSDDEAEIGPTRNACNRFGFESVALIPMRLGDHILGLIHLADSRENLISQQTVKLLEWTAQQLALAIQRITSEILLKESEERIRQIGDNLPEGGIYRMLHTPDGRRFCTHVSRSYERLFLVKPAELMKDVSVIYDMFLPEDIERVAQLERESIENLDQFNFEAPALLPNGETRWFQWHSKPSRLDDGTLIWDGVCLDITRRKQAEDALHQSRDDLEVQVQNRTKDLIATNKNLKHEIESRKQAEDELKKAYSEIENLKNKLEAECTYLGEEIKLMHDHEHIIGESEVMKYILYSLEQIAPTDTTVLILGESGTGKELIARAIHHGSKRKERPLVKVDCTALPANLIESELFGHEKGAFTGAFEKRIGRFELADGATIFLDEIGELPVDLQQKLLRVLQDGEFERLGSSQVMHTDVRVIAATNRNLEVDVNKGRFRKDLWYRINVFPLSIPPLRDRADDIPLLVNWIIKKVQRPLGKNIKSVPTDVMNDLKAYPWPGNVREMENVIERAVIITRGSMLQLAASLKAPESGDNAPLNGPMKSLSEMEKEYILQALRKTNWNISGEYGAAELLGLNSSTLRGRMRKHGIHRPSFKP
ncbi:sigma 54-interacting transcriptional regulator [Thermodesulfobacteriota bacterium]